MPSILTTQINEPPQRKFFNDITSTKNHTRHFSHDRYDKIPLDTHRHTTKAFPLKHHVSLSDNSKFLLCCFMWYLSSSLSSNTAKQIMNTFKYPVTLTFVQFLMVACWCALMERIFKSSGIKTPTKAIVQTIAPLSSFMIVGHVFSSISISRIPVSLVHTIKALAPLFTVLFYRFIFNVHYSSQVYTALIPLTMGVILACSFTFSNNLIGLGCAFCSCLVFVMQNIFNKKLLFKESKMGEHNPNKLDKMNMMFYSAFIAFLLMIPMWFYYDGYQFLIYSDSVQRDVSKARLLAYFLLNGTTHFAQSWFAFTTLGMSSPVTYSIASLVKRIFVIVMSIIWFGQQVSFSQMLGIALTFIGLWMYQKAKREIDQGETKANENSVQVLPTTNIELNENPTNNIKKWIDNQLNANNEKIL
ncbi:triose-phosphate transporter family-domain-containing protein [Parasitella parasitica]|nr:triose-phosphate transporter family-domain-containing protein [Parasitella parasitica]